MTCRVRLLAILLLLGACGAPAEEPAPRAEAAGPPNVVVILADDLGYGDLGSYGADLIATPRLDAMAAEGVRLTSFYAAANVCTPSRAGLLTGRQPIRYGLAAGVVFPQSEHGLPPEEVTLAETLRARGYTTLAIGKWHLGHQPQHWPTAQGFDAFYGVPYSNDMSPFPLYRNDEVLEAEVDQRTLTKRYTEEAVRFVEAAEGPFFLYLAHTFPHIPLHASDAFEGRSEASRYGDTVEEIDWSTGEILDALDRAGLTENTLVVFTSDNGPWFEGSPGALRGRKGETYDGGHRVPFLARWPGMLPAGAVRDAPLTGLDLMPTVARLADAPLPDAEIDGRDAWPVLAEGAASPHEHVLFFNEDQIVGVRRDDWHLVSQTYYKRYDVALRALGYPLLFDLSRDPGMRYSLAPSEPETTAALAAVLDAERERYGVPPPPALPAP